jgi:hypothetical protein
MLNLAFCVTSIVDNSVATALICVRFGFCRTLSAVSGLPLTSTRIRLGFVEKSTSVSALLIYRTPAGSSGIQYPQGLRCPGFGHTGA